MEVFKKRPHASIKEIVEKARVGDAFFVNRATLNGDLAPLPDDVARLIVAVANDQAAANELDLVIPLSDEKFEQQQEFVAKHADRAVRVFTREGGKDLREQVSEFFTKG